MLVQVTPQSDRQKLVHVSAPAKVNLFLEVLAKRSDGFHELSTVMTSVSLFDQISFKPNLSGEICLTISHARASSPGCEEIPVDHRNLIVSTLHVARELFGDVEMGMDVALEKWIPSSAGLGGASSNAAAAVVAADLAWGLNMTDQDRHQVAASIGSDVPFFLCGGMALCTGRGELVEPLPSLPGIELVIAKPAPGLSTPAIFKRCTVPQSPVDVQNFVDALAQGAPAEIAKGLHNRLQPVAEAIEVEVLELARAFEQTNCLGHQMSGSGTSYFGMFADAQNAQTAARDLGDRHRDWDVFNVQSLGRSEVIAA